MKSFSTSGRKYHQLTAGFLCFDLLGCFASVAGSCIVDLLKIQQVDIELFDVPCVRSPL